MKAWLKGGLIGLIYGIFSFITIFSTMDGRLFVILNIPFLVFTLIFCGWDGGCHFFNVIVAVVSDLLFFFGIGAAVNFIIQKIRRRK